MKMKKAFWSLALALTCASACSEDVSPHRPVADDSTTEGVLPGQMDGAVAPVVTPDAGGLEAPELPCRQPVLAEVEPARQKQGLEAETVVTATDLYARFFVPQCGSCHSGMMASNDFYVTSAHELAPHLETMLLRMETADRDRVMPSTGKILLSERVAPDPVLELHGLLKAWRDAGKGDVFPDPRARPSGEPTGSTTLAAAGELAKALTNMGSCVPAARIVYSDPSGMDDLDAKFAAIATNKDLPLTLSETDLTTLDSELLAKTGVISYAPTYTLWADDAKKMRYVRVPRGQSIAFSVATQSFAIPDNTRFYKSFTKEVKGEDGTIFYKKMETRIIVVRKAVERPGEMPEIKALFGTYRWNDDETEATLERTPLQNGEPFRDNVVWYVTDEEAAKPDIEAAPGMTLAEKRERAKPVLFAKKLARHYAIPGSERCVQCHMGGPDGSFVLAFSPLQIMRRPLGESGVIEPAGPDELNQLERFIDYGLITGLSKDELQRKVLPLEKSQGARSPRTNEELVAQGYMLGNCAHCHNPKGFASLSAPALTDLLDFVPSAAGGGIFEFPLDRVSPRIQRSRPGLANNGSTAFLPMPYIVPDVYDHPDAQDTMPSGWTIPMQQEYAAPWRSLIYRNVDTPFAYSADNAIFPHMPMNTPGFDCRAPRIMAEWMLSIPAVPKVTPYVPRADPQPQPFREVRPGDAYYENADFLKSLRLSSYRRALRASYCPDTRDIIDSQVKPPQQPVPEAKLLGIPARPHWVEMDLTDPPNESGWEARQRTWYTTLVERQPLADDLATPEQLEHMARLVDVLNTASPSEALRQFATAPLPLGLWKQKSGCDFSGVPRVDSFASEARPEWFDVEKPAPDAPVYMQPPGGAVFDMICSNCHGKEFDSRGRQADSLLLMTGGLSRVANFKSGLFGPPEAPGMNIASHFGRAASEAADAEDWAARYMAFMALGGTSAVIPQAILNVVGVAPVLGKSVDRHATASPNMLAAARAICAAYLPESITLGGDERPFHSREFKPYEYVSHARLPRPTSVVETNGDAELWRALCGFENAIPIRVYGYQPIETGRTSEDLRLHDLYRREGYPATAAVMDHRFARQTGVRDENLEPWCMRAEPTDSPHAANAERFAREYGIAICPPELFATIAEGGAGMPERHKLTDDDKVRWSLRGAVNAGFAVFSYLRAATSGQLTPQFEYDRCDLLKQPAP